MAKMIPEIMSKEDFNGSYGEERVYNALKEQLPDDCTVFHSIGWSRKDNMGYVRWGESDFTLYDPHRGILTIEVKSGLIACSGNKIIQENQITHERVITDPLKQANKCKYTFKDLLCEKGIEDIWIESAVWFTSIKKNEIQGDLPPVYKEEFVLCKENLSNAKKSINDIFDFYKMARYSNFDPATAKKVVNVLAPEFKSVPSITNLAEEQDYYFNRMTREQSYLIDYLEEQQIAAIQGGAGTGKTMLAIEKARRLNKSGKVLFLCFNKLLIEELKNKFSAELTNVTFTNLYALASKTLDKEVLESDIEYYLNNYDKYNWDYKHIILDEGQDFSEMQIKLLHDIAEFENGCFYVFYDKNQLVQQRNSLNWAKSIECRLVLTRNCRNTRSIAETSGLPINYTNIKMWLDIPGRKPNLFITQTLEKYLETLTKIIRNYTNEGFKQSQIVILTCKTLETSVLSDYTSIGSYKLKHTRHGNGILFTTAKKFKGLESDIIIFIDISADTFKDWEAKRVFYVGSSRARHYLDIVSLLNDREENALAETLVGAKKKNARMAIMGALKVKISKID